jgi:hypothetical protein
VGYYTRYELHIVEIGKEDMSAILNDELYDVPVSAFVDGSADDYKWYQHEDEMRAFSKKYPTALFQLSGIGEEKGDYWFKYFKAGKMQKCPGRVVYAEFDPKKMR